MKHEIRFEPAEFDAAVSSSIFRQGLDAIATLEVLVVAVDKAGKDLPFSNLPKKASLSWNSVPIFSGNLRQASRESRTRFKLVFSDGLAQVEGQIMQHYLKGKTLQNAIEAAVLPTGLTAKFTGSFNERMPGQSLGGLTTLAHLHEWSERFGFSFVSRTGKREIHFFRVGKYLEKVDIQKDEKITPPQLRSSNSSLVRSVRARYFDELENRSQELVLGQDELGEKAAAIGASPTLKDRKQWSPPPPQEVSLSDKYHFDQAHQLLAYQKGKKLLEQEQIEFTCFKPMALPGAQIKLTAPKVKNWEEGTYLVQSAQIECMGASTKMRIQAGRM